LGTCKVLSHADTRQAKLARKEPQQKKTRHEKVARCWARELKPVILATWEKEIQIIAVRDQSEQKVFKILSQTMDGCGDMILLSQLWQEA
jgi:lysophospholipid acyltransferase (LPLAT)-like uncharacterized protein